MCCRGGPEAIVSLSSGRVHVVVEFPLFVSPEILEFSLPRERVRPLCRSAFESMRADNVLEVGEGMEWSEWIDSQ